MQVKKKVRSKREYDVYTMSYQSGCNDFDATLSQTLRVRWILILYDRVSILTVKH